MIKYALRVALSSISQANLFQHNGLASGERETFICSVAREINQTNETAAQKRWLNNKVKYAVKCNNIVVKLRYVGKNQNAPANSCLKSALSMRLDLSVGFQSKRLHL